MKVELEIEFICLKFCAHCSRSYLCFLGYAAGLTAPSECPGRNDIANGDVRTVTLERPNDSAPSR